MLPFTITVSQIKVNLQCGEKPRFSFKTTENHPKGNLYILQYKCFPRAFRIRSIATDNLPAKIRGSYVVNATLCQKRDFRCHRHRLSIGWTRDVSID